MTSATSTRRGRRAPQQQEGPSGRRTSVAPASPVAASPRTLPRPGSLGPVRLQQLILVELAATVMLAAWVADTSWLLAPAGAVAALLLLLAVLRRGRRPLPEWYETTRALRQRRRDAKLPVPPGTDAMLAPLLECDPALRTYGFVSRDDRSIGMIGDGTFLTAVLFVQPGDQPLRPESAGRQLPLQLIHGALEVDGIRLASAQVVQHTQPAPAPHLPQQAVAARSYGPLQAKAGSPALRLTWVALKLDPELCAEAVQARGDGVPGAQRALLRVADQLASRLAGAGFKATLLDENELVQALATSSCLNPRANAQHAQDGRQPQRRTVESVRTWRVDDRWHTTYWLSRWPQLGDGGVALPELITRFTSLPVLATTFSVTLGRAGNRGVSLTGHIRVTARGESELGEVGRELERAASAAKAGLVRLDREQVPGALATLPLGGTY
ncbi:type VII secretion protein EccE [Streptomyces sp. NPDC059837]|uniref:type VII secretion protein EccE n=1 Tax=unclassified Streptomyces TaxID=2593676 RepID=UPI002250ECC5|nr:MULTISPECIES: type VII secretion protein EccE [unclassified Streptomyces]MCX4407593.1 type VII secretion protein EccE [Streptomyces sp. NBC_01764]MCX5187688.1 type VII secretion protein EccE [Streptomyces sp. NBC_00268]